MPLARTMDLLLDAKERGYGIPAFNVFNYEMIACAIRAGEAEGMPVIVEYYPGDAHVDGGAIHAITTYLGARARVPVALHLDHSRSFEVVMQNIRWFSSVMIDGSSLPYDENMALTRRVCESAHAMDVRVEAELGHVGAGANPADIRDEGNFTSPEQAREFLESTGADSLAIAIGNAHGDYAVTPTLDFDRITRVRAQVSAPLVLHGGSGVPGEQFTECVRRGMQKFNVFTEMNKALLEGVAAARQAGRTGMEQALMDACEGLVDKMRRKFQILNPRGLRLF